MQQLIRTVGVVLMLFSGGTFVFAGGRALVRGGGLWLLGDRVQGRVLAVGNPCLQGPGECVEFGYTDAEGGTHALQSRVPDVFAPPRVGDSVVVHCRGEDDAELGGSVVWSAFWGLLVTLAGLWGLGTAWGWARNRG